MRCWTLLPASLALACTAGQDKPTDSDTDAAPVTVAQCSEAYTAPGPQGTVRTDIDPHEDVFGTDQLLDDQPDAPTVGPDPVHVHLGWPGVDTSTSISFVWTTDAGTLSSVVEWGQGDALDRRSEGVSFTYGGKTGADYRAHELKLCGRLKPGTTYSYRVGGDGHWSPTYQFTTPGAPGSFDTFTVGIAGDSRGAYETWGTVVDRLEAHDPDFYMFSGDMVDVGGSERQWWAWWEASGDVFARKVIVPAHGNHEFLAASYFALFSLPNNEMWFSVDYGTARLVSLNDTTAANTDMATQATFIEEQLADDVTWKLAMHHQTGFTASDAHPPNSAVRDTWVPAWESTDVDLVFAGHNHLYERTVPVQGNAEAPTPGEGIVYVVSGGAGAPLYTELADSDVSAVANPVEHYLVAEFSPEGATVTARSLTDEVIDTFTVPAD